MMVTSVGGHSPFMPKSPCFMGHGNILNPCLIFALDIFRSVQDSYQERDLYMWYVAVIYAW
jgi:hypothetical protein